MPTNDSFLNNPSESQSQKQIEQRVYRALTRTSAALYRAYVLRDGDEMTGARIEVIWAVMTSLETLHDERGWFPMETPIDQIFGRFVLAERGYSVVTESIVTVDAEYKARFATISEALQEAGTQIEAAVRGICSLLILYHDPDRREPLETLAECLRKCTNAAALITTLRQGGMR